MRVVILHNAVAPDAPAEEADVLVQARAVSEALAQLGHEAVALEATLNLDEARRRLLDAAPDVVFNLVESLGGTDRLQYFVAGLLDVMEVPYTGCPTEGLFLAGDKLLCKRLLKQAGVPTPEWATAACPPTAVDPPYILKTVAEHASFGIDDSAVVRPESPEELLAMLRRREEELGRRCYAERFVDGREFNLALVEGEDGMEVLPPAEIEFVGFPVGKPHIVGRAAKWEDGSPEWRGTPRRFDFPPGDEALLDVLRTMAGYAARVLGLCGYARVDFRVDGRNRPWVLEVNANPCLSPDAGFAAAAERAGLSYAEVVRRLVAGALARHKRA